MKGHKEQKDEDVIKADDISFDLRDEKTKQIPNWFTKVIQCTINAFQRQGFINLKLLADSGMAPLTELGKNPSVFVKGYPWRFAYQNSAIFFPLYLRDEFLREKDLSVPETSFFTAGAEAIIGSGIELMSVKKTLKQTDRDISSPARTTGMLVLPFTVRNYFAWLAVNSDEKNLAKKAAYGGLAGIVSAPFDSFANQVMRIDPVTTRFVDIYRHAWKNLDLRTTFKAAPYRGAGGALAATILSKQFAEEVVKVINPLFQHMVAAKPGSDMVSGVRSEKINPGKENQH